MIRVTLYTKPGCHLCEPVAEAIAQVRRWRAFEVEARNILDDPRDYEQYKSAIPVVLVNGREVARYRLTPAQLVAALDAANDDPR